MSPSFAPARPTAALNRMSLPRFIILATSVFLFTGLGSLLAWLRTGQVECAATFFRGPGALYLVFLAALQFSLCRIAVRQFSIGEALRPAWFLLMLSGGCHLVSAICVQILSVHSPLNPLTHSLSAGTASDLYRFGLLVGGPLQMILMAGGLGWMLQLSRRNGMRPQFHLADSVPLAIAGLLAYLQISGLVAATRAGNELTLYDLISAATGPLLILLLAEASLVRSCMSVAGGGMIARCWSSFAAAVFLAALSNLGLWLDAHGLLSAAPATMSRFVSYLAATAYALGPAWQIEAIQSACGKIGVSRFSPVATWLSALRLLNTGRAH
jgi:hypothetical protein